MSQNKKDVSVCGVAGNGDIKVVQPLAKRPAPRRNHIRW